MVEAQRDSKAAGWLWWVIASLLVCAVAVFGGKIVRHFTKKQPQPENLNVATVPPPGIQPFDPRPLTKKREEALTVDKFRFVVLGDSKHAKTLPAFLKYLDEKLNPDFVLTTGDMVAKGGGSVGPGFYEMLSGEMGVQMRKRGWWPAIGNHEIAGTPVIGGNPTKEGEVLKANFSSGVGNFMRFYNLDNDYYSFTFRNSTFIALPFPMPQGAQVEWLEAELKKASDAKKHIFVFNHVAFFTVGAKGVDEVPNKPTALTALFEKYHVAAVFSGHDHGYYRTTRNGVVYIVSAGGGANIYPGKRVGEALPDDVYYYADAATFDNYGPNTKFILHKNGAAAKESAAMDQFMSAVDVDGDKINCICVTPKGETFDELPLAK